MTRLIWSRLRLKVAGDVWDEKSKFAFFDSYSLLKVYLCFTAYFCRGWIVQWKNSCFGRRFVDLQLVHRRPLKIVRGPGFKSQFSPCFCVFRLHFRYRLPPLAITFSACLAGLNPAAGKARKRVGEFGGGGMQFSHTWNNAKLLPPATIIKTPPSFDCERT